MTGERVASLTESKAYLAVTPTKELHDAVKSASAGTLFAIHNHPHSTPPSGSDFSASIARNYAGAVVALHDGGVYFYKHGHSGFSAHGFDEAVEDLKNKGATETSAYEQTLDEYKGRFGIEWRRIEGPGER